MILLMSLTSMLSNVTECFYLSGIWDTGECLREFKTQNFFFKERKKFTIRWSWETLSGTPTEAYLILKKGGASFILIPTDKAAYYLRERKTGEKWMCCNIHSQKWNGVGEPSSNPKHSPLPLPFRSC